MRNAIPTGPMTRRLLKWYDRAETHHIEQGTRWYTDARTFAEQLARGTEYTLAQAAGVIAVLSPQVSWSLNMEAAREAITAHGKGERTFLYSGYGANMLKAIKVLDGDLDVIRGPKVRAFYAAIRGDMSSVTVDVWMLRAARQHRANVARVFRSGEMGTMRERRAVEESIRRAAAARGVSPAVFQAIAWTCVRDVNPYPAPMGDDASAARWYRRQIRARVALGLTLHTGDYAWGGAPRGQAAFVEASGTFGGPTEPETVETFGIPSPA